MPIDIEGDAGGDRAERIPDGELEAEIVRIFCAGKEGGPLKTKAGDRKIRIIFGDENGCEAMYEAMVEGPAKFKIARLLKHAGHSSDMLAAEGITEYTHFLDQRTAERFLKGQRVRINVTTRFDGDKEYADVETLPAATSTAEIAPAEQKPKAKAKAPAREDVPF